ncbi:Ribosomal protein 63, mitochondrial [Frankliniella fusca]|uniref:Ribosomal protein 63, mitochondrial n=1 Tax=Frankliniella fusca TaxID=407009 RepID=A0AAE1H1V6_9NEOP|nr:Ribosomal protein 63, mitochondrial [Frankliniella fusca]
MRLSIVNLFKKMPNGNIFIGKYKILPKFRYWMRRELLDDIKREEQNMLYLRHHYLSHEQIKGYRYDLKKGEAFFQKVITAKKSNFPKHIKLEQQLGVLRNMESWEDYK